MTTIIALAWIFGVLSTIFTLMRIAGFFWYHYTKLGQVDKMRDRLKGFEATWSPVVPGIISIICWVIIFTL